MCHSNGKRGRLSCLPNLIWTHTHTHTNKHTLTYTHTHTHTHTLSLSQTLPLFWSLSLTHTHFLSLCHSLWHTTTYTHILSLTHTFSYTHSLTHSPVSLIDMFTCLQRSACQSRSPRPQNLIKKLMFWKFHINYRKKIQNWHLERTL